MANNNNDNRQSWMTQQRQRLGKDWYLHIKPDQLNNGTRNIANDIFHGNIGPSDLNNPDFNDLCSPTIVLAMMNYYYNKIINIEPIIQAISFKKAFEYNSIQAIEDEVTRNDELKKAEMVYASTPIYTMLNSRYSHYIDVYNSLYKYYESNYTNYALIDHVVRAGFKTSNRWVNPNNCLI